jgi:hypothetical protein
MPERFRVSWSVELESEHPLEAVRQAFNLLWLADTRPTRFDVGFLEENGAVRYFLPVELGKENPLGWPQARIEGQSVCCGHCGSDRTQYREDVTRHAALFAENGIARYDPDDFEYYELGCDGHVICEGCGRESGLPDRFENG